MNELQQSSAQRAGEDRMDMRSLVEVLIRRRWIILSVALPVVLVAMIGTLRSTQMFRARTTLMIEVSGPSSPSFYSKPVNYDVVLSSAAELGMSAPVAAQAAVALVDSLPMLQRTIPEWFTDVRTVEELQQVLHEGVNSTHVGESNLMNLSYSHANPRFALMGAGALADAFIGFNITTKRNSPAVEFYSDQIVATEMVVDSLMAIRTAVLDSTGLLGMQADLKMTFNQIRGLETDYYQTRSRREGLEAKVRSVREAVADNPDFVPAVNSSSSGSLNRLKGELDTKLAELVVLKQRYNDGSNWVERAEREIAALRLEIAKERDNYIRSMEVDLAEVRSIERSFQAAHESSKEAVINYPKVRGKIETLDQRIDGLRRLLQSLELKRGEVRMSASSDARISDVLLIEKPVMDVPVGRGRKILYLIISVVLAISMGLVAAFFVESNDHRIYDRRRAELYLEVPVLGSLPDTAGKSRV